MALNRTIKGHDLFAMLTPEQMNKLSDVSAVKVCRTGEIVFDYNQPATHVYMLMSGTVQLRLPAEQQEISFLVSNIQKGELFGLSPLLESPRYTSMAICLSEAELLSIDGLPFRELLKNNCMVGYTIMNRVAHTYFHRYIEVLRNLQGVVNQISLIQ